MNKTNELAYLLDNEKPLFVAITETKLDSSVDDTSIVRNSNYVIVRKDRNRHGGGVALIIHKKITCFRVLEHDLVGESVFVDMILRNCVVRVGVCYRPPNPDDLDKLQRDISLATDENHTCIIVGDFNLNTVNWNTATALDRSQLSFALHLYGLGFEQYVTEPTRYNPPRILDLVLSNENNLVFNVDVGPKFATSDHCTVNFLMNLAIDNPPIPSPRRNFIRANYYEIECFFLSVNWELNFWGSITDNLRPVHQFWDFFYSTVIFAIDSFVPWMDAKDRGFLWPTHVKNLQCRRINAWKSWTRYMDPFAELEFDRLTHAVKKAETDFLKKLEAQVLKSKNSKRFYSFVNSRTKFRPTIPVLRDSVGNFVSSDIEKANLLNNHFSSVFLVDNGLIPYVLPSPVKATLSTVTFDVEKVYLALRHQGTGFASGPDEIPPIFIKKCAFGLALPLSIIFDASMQSGVLPAQWSLANVVALYKKKGNSSDPASYRDISLLSVFCKTMESIIVREMMRYCTQNELISSAQFAYLSNKGTVTQLLSCFNDFTKSIDQNRCVDIIYIDIQKAFNSVSHEKLILKLRSIGVLDPLLSWIKAFLSDRMQRVRINEYFSQWCDLSSGVPQGSVLGPLLFILFINDLTDVVNYCSVKLYADDAKLYLSFDRDETPDHLKDDLAAVAEWADTWQLTIAFHKCYVMHLGHSNPKTTYGIGGVDFPSVDSVKDLGVTFSSSLKFSEHCGLIAKKAFYHVNLIFRNFISRDPAFLTAMFSTYVRPHLEYGSAVWNPHLLGDIRQVESVQRSFTRRVVQDPSIPYIERLVVLDMETLEFRRLCFDLTIVYKIIHGIAGVHPEEFFDFSESTRTRGHSLKLRVMLSRLNCRKFSFALRIVAPWNSLPESVVTAKNAKIFASRLSDCGDALSGFLKWKP